jgi:hypothetical protein
MPRDAVLGYADAMEAANGVAEPRALISVDLGGVVHRQVFDEIRVDRFGAHAATAYSRPIKALACLRNVLGTGPSGGLAYKPWPV